MSNIVKLYPKQDVAQGLRNIIDRIESGEIEAENCTLIIGIDVFHLGCVRDNNAASDAIFNMTYGIQRLMSPVIDLAKEYD